MTFSHYRPLLFFVFGLIFLVASSIANLKWGAYALSWAELWQAFTVTDSGMAQVIVWEIRLPRLLLGLLLGAALAVGGAMMQGLFRNPLADPGLLGIASGAALAAVAVIVLGNSLLLGLTTWLGLYTLPIAAFIGGLLTTLLVYGLAQTQRGRTSIATLLLAGIAINAFNGALLGLLTYIADDQQLRTLTFWSMGSLAAAGWQEVALVAPWLLVLLLILPWYAKALNALLLGETEAQYLGFAVERIKTLLLVITALLVGLSVSLAGIIGFIGLVVPHLVRLLLGPDYRSLLPASLLLGAWLLTSADLLARLIIIPAELPIGLLTAGIGGPFFLWLLWRQRQQWSIS